MSECRPLALRSRGDFYFFRELFNNMMCRIFHYHRNASAEFLKMTLYIPLSVQSLDMFLSAWIRVDPVPDPKRWFL